MPGQGGPPPTAVFQVAPWVEKLARAWLPCVLFPTTVLFFALNEERLKRFARNSAWLGDISYSTYLLHFPLQLAFVIVAGVLGLSNEIFYGWGTFALFFATLIPMGLVSYHLLEKPAQGYLRTRFGGSSRALTKSPSAS